MHEVHTGRGEAREAARTTIENGRNDQCILVEQAQNMVVAGGSHYDESQMGNGIE